MADNSPSPETQEPQSPPPGELNSLADLLQLMSEGRSLTPQEIKELNARMKVREEMAKLADRMQAFEEHEQSRIRIPEHTQRPSKRSRQIRSDPSSDEESSYPESDTSPDSDHNSSENEQPSRKKRRTHWIKVTPDYTLSINSSLREWGDWKREMDRVFEGDPATYRKGNRRILKALDYVDKPLKTLWYTYCDQKSDHEIKKWKTFITWTKENIQNGQNTTATLYERYETARHKPDQSPSYFNAYLSSIERDLPIRDEESSAFAFYSKLSHDLKKQFKTANIKIPKTRSKCVAVAQRVWEGLQNKDHRGSRSIEQGPKTSDTTPKDNNNHRRDRQHHDKHPNPRFYHDSKKHREDRSKHGDKKEHIEKNLCFNCGKPGHFAPECPEKKHAKIQSASAFTTDLSPVDSSTDSEN
jgi:hypothetical protein